MDIKKRVGLLVLLFLVLGTAPCLAQDVRILVTTDKESYMPGEEVQFSVFTYFNNILVLSVPVMLEVTDPFDDVHIVELQGHTNGEYKGSFTSQIKGEYMVRRG